MKSEGVCRQGEDHRTEDLIFPRFVLAVSLVRIVELTDAQTFRRNTLDLERWSTAVLSALGQLQFLKNWAGLTKVDVLEPLPLRSEACSRRALALFNASFILACSSALKYARSPSSMIRRASLTLILTLAQLEYCTLTCLSVIGSVRVPVILKYVMASRAIVERFAPASCRRSSRRAMAMPFSSGVHGAAAIFRRGFMTGELSGVGESAYLG